MIRVIALGTALRGDDGFALALAERACAGDPRVELILAGRPGLGLLDLLDTSSPVVLLDVVVSGAEPGTLHRCPLAELPERVRALVDVSSHGQGPAEALSLARALGRELPPGEFVGVEASRFELGQASALALTERLDELAALVRGILDQLEAAPPVEPPRAPCTSPD